MEFYSASPGAAPTGLKFSRAPVSQDEAARPGIVNGLVAPMRRKEPGRWRRFVMAEFANENMSYRS